MSIDELTIRWEDENGVEATREIDKVVLTRGMWVTIMFLYQVLDKKTEEYGEPQARIVRYKKIKENYVAQSKFNISGKKQAMQIVEQLQRWYSPQE